MLLRLGVVSSLLLVASCAGERGSIAAAVNTYNYAYDQYTGDCTKLPRNRTLPDCQAFYKALLDSRKAIQAAQEANSLGGKAPHQEKALEDALSRLEKEVR